MLKLVTQLIGKAGDHIVDETDRLTSEAAVKIKESSEASIDRSRKFMKYCFDRTSRIMGRTGSIFADKKQ